MAKKTMIGVCFPESMKHIENEIKERAAKMNMSAAKYCRIILVKHISSGDALTIADK